MDSCPFVNTSLNKKCYEEQLQEVENIQAIYDKQDEFKIEDYNVILDIKDYLKGVVTNLPNQLELTINLKVDDVKVEIFYNLAQSYPDTALEAYARCDKLNREQQAKLNEDLNAFISTEQSGQAFIFDATNWINSNISIYIDRSASDLCKNAPESKLKADDFSRFWIYSHHIYSKTKRRIILSLAEDLHITGFCLPGKPGVVCIEGTSLDCEDWWHRIKSMTWKKINVIKREDNKNIDNLNELRFFKTFDEIAFQSARLNKSNEYHMDMGEFHRYLELNNCSYVFKDLFGVEGKSS